MTVMINLPDSKVRRLKERAKYVGVSAEELAGKLVEFIVDSSEEDFEGWIETFEILLDNDFSKRLQESMEQPKKGNVTEWNKAKRELGIG